MTPPKLRRSLAGELVSDKDNLQEDIPIAFDVLQQLLGKIVQFSDIDPTEVRMLLDLMPGLDRCHLVALLWQFVGSLQEGGEN